MTAQQTRRDVMGAATVVAAAMTAAALPSGTRAQPASAGPKMEYAIKKLPFDPAKVKGLSEKLLVSHYENNYSGAVKRLNAITAQLASLDVAAAPATGLSEACTHFLPIGPCNSEIPRSVDQLRSKAIAWRASVERAWKASLKSSPSLRTSPNI